MRIHILLLVAAVTIPGCLTFNSHNSQNRTETSSLDEEGMNWQKDFSCLKTTAVAPMDRLHAQLKLPRGYESAPATEFFGVPSLGTSTPGLALVHAMTCSTLDGKNSYREGSVGIFVRAPDVEGVSRSDFNVYELWRFVGNNLTMEALQSVDWRVLGNSVTVNVTSPPLIQASANAGKENESWITITATALSNPSRFPMSLRWWHQTALGTGFFDYNFTNSLSAAGKCSVSYAPWAGDLVGGGVCPPETLFEIGAPTDANISFHWLHDTFVRDRF